jgi:ABC-2 type transport system ATP-binding protein
VAFIGPNGAGKSTTLKMLSGILYSDSGEIKILDKDPQKNRVQLAYKIGTIFGQKPQLWFHLPAMDSFNLFSKIYDLDDKEYRKRIEKLIDLFEIREFVNQPVRRLSLGQRMRCEFVLALIHGPKILFLDEPTIGMDIVVKKTIRELIKKINREEKVTVILTSHDMGDVESICDRAIIINHGRKIYDGKIDELKRKFLNKKVITVRADKTIKLPKRTGIILVKKSKYEQQIEIDTAKVSIKLVVDALVAQNVISDILIEEPPIEEVIETIYKQK